MIPQPSQGARKNDSVRISEERDAAPNTQSKAPARPNRTKAKRKCAMPTTLMPIIGEPRSYSLRVSESNDFGGCRYLNPPAIPFCGSSSATNGRGFQELGSGES